MPQQETKQEPKTEEITEEMKKKLLELSEISLSLDTYDDIFSDFDSRPHNQRALSDDFLVEAKKAVRNTPAGNIELKFMIPHNQRNTYQEAIIKKRLKEHFKKHYHLLNEEKNNMIKHGFFSVAVASIIMFIATYILFYYGQKTFFITFITVLLEPAGWFLFWEGMHQMVFDSKQKNLEVGFYHRMSKCEVTFLGY